MASDIICGECIDPNPDEQGYYEFRWNDKASQHKTTFGGTTGFATILYSTNANFHVDKEYRIHVCAHNPCQARWKYASKYGWMGVPMHVQQVPKRAAVAVAESSGSTTLATAVAEAPPVEDSLSAAAGSDEAVAEVPTTMLAQPDALKSADDDEVASHLKEVPLRALIPPAPAATISCGSGAGDCSGGAAQSRSAAVEPSAGDQETACLCRLQRFHFDGLAEKVSAVRMGGYMSY